MARKVRNSGLENRTARLKLAIRRKPYPGPLLGRGIKLNYRRCKGNGSWVLKASDGHGRYWEKVLGQADDYDEADGKTVQTYFQAIDTAKELARGGGEGDTTAPITVERALVEYKADLSSRGARAYNADHPRAHLTAVLLSKPIVLLTSRELKAWRDSLLGTLAPASINRLCNSVRAALELAAQHDERITNRSAWEIGLAVLPGAQRARNVVLSDATIHALVAAAYARDQHLGLLIDVLAMTGARPIQAARLRVEDLQAHAVKPKLMMPKTAKGGGRNRSSKKSERYSVPITTALAKRLKAAAAGRAPDTPLLVQADGSWWGEDPSRNYRRDMREVLTSVGENPDMTTVYALRHSNICRMLLKNIPVRLIASLHNTSIQQIEKSYSARITEHSSDDLSRTALLPEPVPAADNVIPLAR